jgi:phytanoyl-CoA hydroxylase
MFSRWTEAPNLWALEVDGARQIQKRRSEGQISAIEAAQLQHFAEKGYVVFEQAVEHDLLDALVRDVRGISDYPGCFLTTDHRAGKSQRLSGPDFDAYESIFDTYVNFESARAVCFHPTILNFLELLFDACPVAHQQLLFQRSNQHPIHQDTAYVCAEEPLLMAATWIALEDVVPGRGELTYYEGSHKIPHYRYADGTKRFNPARDDAQAARAHILQYCERMGCAKQDFFAKKGDVFVWAADLAHGSNPRTRPDEETRMSLVTHYAPESVQPYWFRFHREHRTAVSYGARAKYVSYHYLLPKGPGMAQPTTRIE